MALSLLDTLLLLYPARSYGRVLELGCGTGAMTCPFAQRFDYNELIVNDLTEDCKVVSAAVPRACALPGDAEALDFGTAGFDLILSNAALQWMSRPAELLARCARALRPGGGIALGTFLPGTLREIAALTGNALVYPSRSELERMLEPYFEIQSIMEKEVTLLFPAPEAVLKHLKNSGVNSLERSRWTRGRLVEFSQRYRAQFGRGDEVVLTYRPIEMTAQLRKQS